LSSNLPKVLSLQTDSSKSVSAQPGAETTTEVYLFVCLFFFFHSTESFIAGNKNNETSSHVAFFF